eukprot:CAMPEP_0198700970 /NCGR_PEP_ID=MMETSP1468-20131203/377776_1 /TAXON_ID=1461545 /ORGANISM="Mantoniella sp, Strain CCMP1436" /LENGTH=34 /DNA_ID= /DNA_START= /DNA_END= /DNA_ORIENTATION=
MDGWASPNWDDPHTHPCVMCRRVASTAPSPSGGG